MAIAKARLLEPLRTDTVGVIPSAMVIGGGVAGMTAALSLADQGFHVSLIEKEKALGGLLKNLHRTLEGDDVRAYLKEKIEHVMAHEYIKVYTDVEVKKSEGFIGNFETTLTNGDVIRHGAIILATGGIEYQPTEYLYHENNHVITQRELEEKLASGDNPQSGERYVMIQCVGSREEPNQYCSRTCCQDAIKNAITLKERNPKAQVLSCIETSVLMG
jgi:heterodisulfide reductase subunit A